MKSNQVPVAEWAAALKDRKTGERPLGFIVPKTDEKITNEEVIEFVAKRVASYKRIKDIVVIDSIPKNASGKILRRKLKENYC